MSIPNAAPGPSPAESAGLRIPDHLAHFDIPTDLSDTHGTGQVAIAGALGTGSPNTLHEVPGRGTVIEAQSQDSPLNLSDEELAKQIVEKRKQNLRNMAKSTRTDVREADPADFAVFAAQTEKRAGRL